MRQKLIYLASPYSHAEESVRNERAERAAEAAAALKRLGYHIFAPIPHGHSMVPYGLPGGYDEFWKPYCRNVLSRVDILAVLTLPGWEISTGVTDEIEIAHDIGIPVVYLSMVDVLSLSQFKELE